MERIPPTARRPCEECALQPSSVPGPTPGPTPGGATAPPLCSVVLVSYHSAEDLPGSVTTLAAAAPGQLLEVVVVDNASGDGSAEVARGLGAGTGLPLKVIESPTNDGYARAANLGAAATGGDWLLVANPDTRFAPGSLARLLATGAADPTIGCVGPHLRNPDGSDYPTGRRFPSVLVGALHALLGTVWPGNPATRRYHLTGVDRSVPVQVDWVSGACMCVRRQAWEKVGGFDPGYFMYAEDMDLCLRIARAGWRVVFDGGAEVVHTVGGSTRYRPYRKVLDHHRSALRFYVRHHRRDPRILLAPGVAAFLAARGLVSLARTAARRGR
ncbi:MAG TPA: glycosyltransferase family 2 protein [Actinomycetes bacterium]|nr:glycosyltransferase family 2 protein [Actinomycetes bacterium]